MKKKYAGLLIGISCVLSSMIFCSCGKNDKKENINEITEQTAQELEQIDDNEAISGQKKENDKSELSENAEKTKEQNSSVEPVETKVENTYMGDLTPSEGLEFESNGDGTCAIKSVGTFEGDNLIIPQTSSEGDTVTEISEDAFYRLECDYIVFDNVTMEVNDSAFSSSEYKNLVINNSNLTIGENAFAYNDKAESVTLLNSECSLDEYALYNTGKHMTIGITDSTIVMEDSAVSGSNEDILLVYNSKIDMGSNAFAYSDDITDVKFENCEITMDEYTFYATGDSASVVFDECDITMQDSALSGNEFETLDMLNCVALEMGDNAIAYSDDLESVNISGTDMKIGEYAFYNDDNLAEITINAGNGQIELKDSAFYGLGDDCEKISITCGTIKMGDDVFAYNDGLLVVSITGTIEKKGSYIFYNCRDDLVINVNGETFNEDTFEDKEY